MRSTVLDQFRARVELYLERHSQTLTQTRFGELAVNDGSFVADLRVGRREFRLSTIEKVEKWMADYEAETGSSGSTPGDPSKPVTAASAA